MGRNFVLFDVKAVDNTYSEGITFRNAEIGDRGRYAASIAGSKGLTVKNSRFENVGAGIFTNYAGFERLLTTSPTIPSSAGTIRGTDRMGRGHVDEVRRSPGQIFARRWRLTSP